MPARLTLEQAHQICQDSGFEPLFDKYINNRTKVLVKCKCGQSFYVKFNNIQSKVTKSCGMCNNPNIGDKFNYLTIIRIIPGKHSCSVICQCDCGKICGPIKFNHLVIGNNKSCGYCKIPEIGDKFNKLTIIKILKNPKYRGYKIECMCDCGRIYKARYPSTVINGNTKSCGHCKDPKTGDRFGKLIIIEVTPNNNGGSCSVKCLCDCGNEFSPIFANLINGKNKSCGNCELLRNGIPTSHIALLLHDLVEEILKTKCEHNKYINGRYFDIVCETLKIVIEYDGYYYHRIKRNTTEIEKKDEHMLRKYGYKLLRIRSDGTDLPTKHQLEKILLYEFDNNVHKRTITMKSWKTKHKGKTN